VLEDLVVTGIILDAWHALPDWFPAIELEEFAVMPNHVHLIVWLLSSDDVEENWAGTDWAQANWTRANRARANRARASLAPTTTGDDVVGATLAVAREVVARDAVAEDRAGARPAPTEWVIPEPDAVNLQASLGDVMGAFKSLVFTVYLDWIEAHDPARRAKFWQRNYYEHVIRSDPELNAIRRYIQENPLRWTADRDNPDNTRRLPPPTTIDEYLEDVRSLR
jgi:REP element-mobilizing transposase RayT